MSNIPAYKRVLSLVLVFVLFVPAGIKVTHHLFVEHDHCHLHGHGHDHGEGDDHSNGVIDREHKVCPVCAFHFVEFFSDEITQLAGTAFVLSDHCPAFIRQEIPTGFLFQIYLRGPPLHS